MTSATRSLYLITLFVVGATALVGVGVLVARQQARPVRAAAAEVVPGRPGVALAQGARLSVETARRGLAGGGRSEGVHALDAARRAADVGRQAASAPRRAGFEQAYDALEKARYALQNGETASARWYLAQAATALDAAVTSTDSIRVARVQHQQVDWTDYEGAVVLDALGNRIGRVVRIRVPPLGTPEALLVLGGVQDFLGFIDLGGRAASVPVTRLIFGRPRPFEAVFVAYPSP